MKPSTTVRASSSRLPIRARIFGSTNRAPGIACSDCMSVAASSGSAEAPDLLAPRASALPLGRSPLLHSRSSATAPPSSSSSMIESVVMPSDSARKLVSTRWRSTGCAMRADVVEADVIAAAASARAPSRRARGTAPRGRWRRTPRTSSPSRAPASPSAGWCARAAARSASPGRPPARGAPAAGTRPDRRRSPAAGSADR